VTASSHDGQTATASISYTVNPPATTPTTTTTTTTTPPPAPRLSPTVTLHITPGTAGVTYRFSGAGSSGPAGHRITRYVWTVASHKVGTGKAITHTFAKPGKVYRVLLTVTDDQGASVTRTITFTPRVKLVHVGLVVHFRRNEAALTTRSRAELRPWHAAIVAATSARITGYCAAKDASTRELLLELSRDRAEVVQRFLFGTSRGTHPDASVIGPGATNFVASNRTAAGRAQNRRAVVSFTYPKPLR
jgi:outer membrane protein OmpA-like peptidoglycan-associated protein